MPPPQTLPMVGRETLPQTHLLSAPPYIQILAMPVN